MPPLRQAAKRLRHAAPVDNSISRVTNDTEVIRRSVRHGRRGWYYAALNGAGRHVPALIADGAGGDFGFFRRRLTVMIIYQRYSTPIVSPRAGTYPADINDGFNEIGQRDERIQQFRQQARWRTQARPPLALYGANADVCVALDGFCCARCLASFRAHFVRSVDVFSFTTPAGTIEVSARVLPVSYLSLRTKPLIELTTQQIHATAGGCGGRACF